MSDARAAEAVVVGLGRATNAMAEHLIECSVKGREPDWARFTTWAARAQRAANELMAIMPREEIDRVSIDMLGRDPGGEE